MIHSFLPVISEKPIVLILGTMPGIASLQQQQYYGHPRNHFWKIMSHLYNSTEIPNDYVDKTRLLLENNLALWDVLHSCDRNGSLDMHIKNPIPNQLPKLLQAHPSIAKIVFNGKESHLLFIKNFRQISDINHQIVPSTSPANTMKFEFKLDLWRRALL
jgi:hypoxanthine-DNA glycosylase